MNRELKLALIVGFAVVLVVAVLISDHLSKARQAALAGVPRTNPVSVETASMPAPPVDVSLSPNRDLGLRPEPRPEPAQPEPGPIFDIRQGLTPNSGDKLAKSNKEPASGAPLLKNDRGDPGDIILVGSNSPKSAPPPIADPPMPVPSPSKTYTVAEGDTMYRIAKANYGDANLWQSLVKANAKVVGDGSALKVGMKLRLPPKEELAGGSRTALAPAGEAPLVKTAEAPTDTGAAPGKGFAQYTVRKGDTVGQIARTWLGSASRADEVMKANADVLRKPEGLKVGMVIRIPR